MFEKMIATLLKDQSSLYIFKLRPSRQHEIACIHRADHTSKNVANRDDDQVSALVRRSKEIHYSLLSKKIY